MQQQKVTVSQVISLYVLMILGTSIIVGSGSSLRQSTWMAVLVGALASLPFLMMQARLFWLFPGISLFQILVKVLGKTGAIVVAAAFAVYSLSLGAMVTRNISEFIQIVTMARTPQYFLMIAMMLLAIWCVKSGLSTMGRCALYGVLPIALIVLGTTALGTKEMQIDRLLPLVDWDAKSFITSVLSIMSFPFLETQLLGTQLYLMKEGQSPYKAAPLGLAAGGLLLTIINIRDMAILGPIMHSTAIFPGYESVGMIELGTFFTRFEAVISASLILCSFMKLGICLLSSSAGMAHMIGIKDYRDIVVPLAMVMLFFAMYMYDNLLQMLSFAAVYQYYALPLQTLVTGGIWIMAEIKAKKLKRQAQQQPEF